MHILVLGATGPSGISFVEEALRAHHQLTVYARNPSKLPDLVSHNASVTIIESSFDDMVAVKTAVNGGAEALVSFAGPTSMPNRGTAVTDLYEKMFPLILGEKACNIKRCLILATASYQASGDRWTLKWWFAVWVIYLLGGSAYAEINGIGRVITAQPLDRLGWTLFRVPNLNNGEAQPVQTALAGDGKDGSFLSRKSLAIWLLEELEEKRYIGKAPMISNVGWL